MRSALVLLLALSLLMSGCLGGDDAPASSPASADDVQAAGEAAVEDLDVSFFDENDSVEIGEMI